MKSRVAISIALMALLQSCGGSGSDDVAKQSLMDASKQELATAIEERDRLLALVREISSGMDEIRRVENVVAINGRQPDANVADNRRVKADIAAIRASLRFRRERLAELEKNLSESAMYNDELKATIEVFRRQNDAQSRELERLNRIITDAEERIGSLSLAVDSLSNTVATVSLELDSANAEAYRLANELNACYFVAASRDELKKHHVIETGFLRKTRLLPGDFDRHFFTTSDKRLLSELPLYSRKAKVHTNHPDGSYEITDRDGSKVLVIADPALFWSLTNYLVVEID
ncbi:MAG: hypothetical protein K2G30_04995 [Muribaculaceae bacterium]|nr:hypothetical protein [Muribaculaceae bacterium]